MHGPWIDLPRANSHESRTCLMEYVERLCVCLVVGFVKINRGSFFFGAFRTDRMIFGWSTCMLCRRGGGRFETTLRPCCVRASSGNMDASRQRSL